MSYKMNTRKCARCSLELPLSSFTTSTESYCRDCKREYNREHHQNVTDERREKMRVNSSAQRKSFVAFLHRVKSVPCRDCGGVFHPVAMDFDHLGDKDYTVAAMAGMSRTRILAEIAKCDVVCSNCHRVRTHERRHTTG